MKNIVIITGASSGIGMEFARQMDGGFSNIDEFWLIARRKEALSQLSEQLRHKTKVLPMDLTDKAALDVLEDTVIRENVTVRMLINCAGYGLMGYFCEQEPEGELGMIRLNCEALTDMTHRIIPYMKKNSRIIQLASSAAFLPQPDFAVYAATKSYVLSFSRALGQELKTAGIYVTSVCPGPVDTPFFDIAESTGSTLAVKKLVMANVDKVVAQALRDSYQKRSMSVYSFPIQAFQALAKVLPHSLILKGMDILKRKSF